MSHVRHFAVLLAVPLAGCLDSPTGQYWPVVEIDLGEQHADGGADTGPDVGEPDLPPEPQPDGSPCATDAECVGGVCLTGEAFPGGLCTQPTCDNCAVGFNCSMSEQFGTFCAPECNTDVDCREGYACRREGGRGETPRRMCTPIRGLPDGEPCADGSDCQGGRCLEWEGGYCTTRRCESSEQCSNLGVADNVCVADGFSTGCYRRCDEAADCRAGYVCTPVGFNESICIEDPAQPFDESVFAPSALNMQCGVAVVDGEAAIPFDIAEATTSYMITPLTRDGNPLDPYRIVRPDGVEMNFVLERDLLKYPSRALGNINPTQVPAIPAFAGMLTPGTNRYELATSASEVCWYLLEKTGPGVTVDLNVYLVGVPGVTASTAPADPNFTALFAEVSRIYGQIGISVGTVRFRDVSDDAVARFGVLRTESDIYELFKLSTPPGADLDSLLSVNVFFVGSIGFSRGALGVSPGLYGPVGLHGTHGSGVLFTSEFMGAPVEDAVGNSTDGNLYTALILAHEVGHWLGLDHTTEIRTIEPDALADTPVCADPYLADRCPDWGNVMFPFAGAFNTNITADQGFVLSANPATHPAPGGVQ